MIWFEQSLVSPQEHLALDEALLRSAEAGTSSEVLRLSELPTYAVILGAGGSVAIDVNIANCERDGVPILRRASGGGTVVLGPGCLMFSLVLSYDRAPELGQVQSSYRWVLDRVRQAILPWATTEQLGISDLVYSGRKFSGNAQQRKCRHLLHHGTLLYQFDLDRVSRYLNAPEREPDYRSGRPHSQFVGNLLVGPDNISGALQAVFGAQPGVVPEASMELLPALIAERYGQDEWHRRR